MIHREEWGINIFIQHQYPVLTHTYYYTISYKQSTREFTRNWGGSKCGIAKWSKTSLNISRGARGVVVIAVGNEHGDTSSNPGRNWLHFT